MKLAKILLAAAVLATASMSHAEPKCSHKENGSLFASTNPTIKAKSGASSADVVRSNSNGAIK